MNQKVNFLELMTQALFLRKSKLYIPYKEKKCLYYSLLSINWVGSSIGRAGAF